MTACLVAELTIPRGEPADWNAHAFFYRDDDGETWGTTPAITMHFELSNTRLSVIAARAGFPADARRYVNGRCLWNATKIECFLLNGRPAAGPLPRYVVGLMAAGRIGRPEGRRRKTTIAGRVHGAGQ